MHQSLQLLSFNYFWNLKSGTQNLMHNRVTLFDLIVAYSVTAHLPYAVTGIVCPFIPIFSPTNPADGSLSNQSIQSLYKKSLSSV